MENVDETAKSPETGSDEELPKDAVAEGQNGDAGQQTIEPLKEATFAVDGQRKAFVIQIPISPSPWMAHGFLEFARRNIDNFYRMMQEQKKQQKQGLLEPGQGIPPRGFRGFRAH